MDKNGKPTNERGYLTNPATGDVINNLNGDKMFDKKELDDRVSFQLLSTLKSTTSILIKSVVILNMIKTVSQLSRKTLRVLSSIREDLK